MKKSLIALAVLAAAGAASAQSSVTMYGLVEIGADIGYKETSNTVVNQVNPTTGAVIANLSNTSTTYKPSFRVQDANSQGFGTSRIGWRGTEDLGGGLKAKFQLEMGLRADDGCVTTNSAPGCTNSGNTGGNLFGRNAWVGLNGGFGEVRMGRQVLGSFAVQGNSWVNDAGNGLYEAGALTAPAMGGVRFADSVKYISPDFGGFSGSLTVSAPEKNTVNNDNLAPVTSSSAKSSAGVDLALEYAKGPLYVGFGYNKRDAVNTTAAYTGAVLQEAGEGKVKGWTIGASYDFGVVKPFFNYTREDTDTTSYSTAGYTGSIFGTDLPAVAGISRTAQSVEHKAWSIGASAPMGAATFMASYGRGTVDSLLTGTNVNGSGKQVGSATLKGFQFGMTYALSKRTMFRANIGEFKSDASQYAVATSGNQSWAYSGQSNDKVRGFNVGIRHTF